MKKIILLIIMLVGLWRCGDVWTPYMLNIDNQSNDTIRVQFLKNSPYLNINSDSLFFTPDEQKMLYGAEGRATKDGCGYTGINKDEVLVTTNTGRVLTKEISDVNNWECSGSYKSGWTMTFVITENDLE